MGIRVMIVDDSAFIYEEMKQMLAADGIEAVGFCRSGEEALELYGEIKPDLVTMDIILPGMDGLDTTRRIVEKWPDARVLMVSSLAYEDTKQWSQELGAWGVLYKPFTAEELVRSVRSAMTDGKA